jgi:hypothetical protein
MSKTDQMLEEVQKKLRGWGDFIEELQVPSDIAVALTTGRPEMINLIPSRALSATECGVLYQLIRGLLETNQALQYRARLIADMAAEVRRGLGGTETMVRRLEGLANYQHNSEREGDR